MSRQIDLTQPLSDEDRKYLEDRDWQHLLDQNALHLMGGGADEGAVEDDSNDSDESNPYKGWHKDEWFAEIQSRNGDRSDEEKIVPEGDTAKDYKAAVLADDQKNA